MSLMDRDYMGETYEEKIKNKAKKNKIAKRKNDLWELYAKKNKSIFDKIKIKKLEKENLKSNK